MTVTFAREILFEVIEDIQPLLQLHYEELAKNQDRVALSPDWPRYAQLEASNALVIFTARKDGALVGYACFFVGKHQHYTGLTLVNNDVLFLAKEHRAGRTGVRFIRYCEEQIAEKFKQGYCIAWHAKEGTTLAGMLGRMGYRVQDIVFAKLG